MNHPPPPLITLPLDLCDEAAETLIDLLLHITHQLQIHFPVPLHRDHNRTDERQPDLWADTDPPF